MPDTQPPTWADLLTAALPEATRLARRIERQHLAGKAPQGVAFVALALLLGDCLRRAPEPKDIVGMTQILADVIAGKHHKPHHDA